MMVINTKSKAFRIGVPVIIFTIVGIVIASVALNPVINSGLPSDHDIPFGVGNARVVEANLATPQNNNVSLVYNNLGVDYDYHVSFPVDQTTSIIARGVLLNESAMANQFAFGTKANQLINNVTRLTVTQLYCRNGTARIFFGTYTGGAQWAVVFHYSGRWYMTSVSTIEHLHIIINTVLTYTT